MKFLKPLFTGVSALGLIASLALSFAPATANEQATLGPDAPRMALVQRRIAIGLRDLAPAPAIGLIAQAAKLPEADLRRALDEFITPTEPQQLAQAAPEPAPSRSIEAGGALFVQVD